MRRAEAERRGLKPMAKLRSFVVTGVAPAVSGIVCGGGMTAVSVCAQVCVCLCAEECVLSGWALDITG